MKSEEKDPLWKIVDRRLKIALRFLVVVYAVVNPMPRGKRTWSAANRLSPAKTVYLPGNIPPACSSASPLTFRGTSRGLRHRCAHRYTPLGVLRGKNFFLFLSGHIGFF